MISLPLNQTGITHIPCRAIGVEGMIGPLPPLLFLLSSPAAPLQVFCFFFNGLIFGRRPEAAPCRPFPFSLPPLPPHIHTLFLPFPCPRTTGQYCSILSLLQTTQVWPPISGICPDCQTQHTHLTNPKKALEWGGGSLKLFLEPKTWWGGSGSNYQPSGVWFRPG